MLKQRIITACVLLAVLALALSRPQTWIFLGLTLVFVGAALWEWLRLLGFRHAIALTIAILFSLLLAMFYSFSYTNASLVAIPLIGTSTSLLLSLAALIWIALSLGLVSLQRFPVVAAHRALFFCAALLLTAACWLALVEAYQKGLIFLLSIMALVWVADIAAYFSGKALGRHKLAPAISPGKTWEGVAGAVLAVWLISAILTQVSALNSSFASQLWARNAWLALPVLAMVVGVSIVGDLFESHLKRQAGVKDSSQLLPGHGGVLDRIDALLPTLPIAVLISRYWNA